MNNIINDKIYAVKGMNDILPNESYQWLWLEEQIRTWLLSYGYQNIRVPIVEHTALFTRAIGEVTDIVEKEMYTFIDSLNQDSLTLRPEGTAGVIRAVTEHEMLYNTSQKLWYMGQMFRHERPQKGRYRQFHQLGVEALGFVGPEIDAEIILMQHDLWNRLGLKNIQLHINCLGNQAERQNHRQELIKYFEKYKHDLDEDNTRRLYTNPLRILDSKNPKLKELIVDAPKLINYLGVSSKEHYTQWKEILQQLKINFHENTCLVRGLDYYNLSVFEWISINNSGSQGTIAGGGRYDPLISHLGGKNNYGIGLAIGLERLLIELNTQQQIPYTVAPDIFIANVGSNTYKMAFVVATQLRALGYTVIQNFNTSSFKSQLKYADALQVSITLIIGENEMQNQQIMVKLMNHKVQEAVPINNLVEYLQNKCRKI